MRHRRHQFMLVSLQLWLGVACGPGAPEEAPPPAWVLGTFSDHTSAAQNVPGLMHYEFREDGSVIVSGVGDYGRAPFGPVEYVWDGDGVDAIDVTLPSPIDGVDRWRITRTSDCKRIELQYFRGEEQDRVQSLYRGSICLVPSDACPAGDCNQNEVEWCDGKPVPCGDEDAS